MDGQLPDPPQQQLPPAAYTSADWFAREMKLLHGRSWSLAGVLSDLAEPGDFVTARAGPSPLAVVRGADGALRGFHNLCRHRGTELLEGAGNAGRTIVCPYHAWSYGLDGTLRGIADHQTCFPQLERDALALHPAAVGVFRELVFVHPDPRADFDAWRGGLGDVAWPHRLSALEETRSVTYEMRCNWKVFFENAVDGYHLKYLHKNTLGGPAPGSNAWDPHGPHLVWYSTELEGRKTALPQAVARSLQAAGLATIPGSEPADYGGVYMLFPTTIVVPNPYNISVSQLRPLAPDLTLLTARTWGLKGTEGRASQDISPSKAARDPVSGHVRLDLLQVHPAESGDFQLEDMWICEKMQRALNAPLYEVAGLARGAGGEAPLAYFQRQVLAALDD